MDFEVGVHRVGFTRQQRRHLALTRFAGKLGQRRFAFRNRWRIGFGFAQFNERDGVVKSTLERIEGAKRLIEQRAFAHDFLRGLGIVPEVRILGARVQAVEFLLAEFRVKDTSAAGRWIP